MNPRRICKHYDGCSAPLCPLLTEEENRKGLWYPDEEICRRRNGIPDWVRKQRKIVKKVKRKNHSFYFTYDMLQIPFRLTEQVKGIDPDKEEAPQLKRWFKRYRGIKTRQVSDRVRKQRMRSLAKARQAVQDQSSDRSLPEAENAAHLSVNGSENQHTYQRTEVQI